MRKISIIKGDIVFQWKYGFYFLYVLVLFVYIIIFSFFEGNVRNIIVSCCVYSDPAAMGMFFMGALILLEKSQHITASLAISPVSSEEYILGKCASFAVISVIVGLLLIVQGHTDSYLLCMAGVFLSSVIFSLCGVIVGTGVSNLNQYIIGTLPFELFGFAPVIAYRIGFMWDESLMLIHPGCAAMRLIEGRADMIAGSFASLTLWIVFLFIIADKCVRKMYRLVGGVKL
ncbi:MAG: ABC transporter permease [Lachnospiraceae bacterium]|nr:ABC transporter permease [Lachnospiraceae bacterium]